MEAPIKYKRPVIPKSYLNGKIYKIKNDVNEMLYIGSTTQTLPKRFYSHTAESAYKFSPWNIAMNTIGRNHFTIVLIELFSCTCKAELEAREYAIMDTYDNAMLYNSVRNGKMSDEIKKKMSLTNARNALGKLGRDSLNFKRGSIRNYTSMCYRYTWGAVAAGTDHSVTICYKRIREQPTAYMMCIDKQNEIYPLIHEDYMKELPFCED